MTVGVKELEKKLGKTADLFTFEEEGKYITAHPKQYLTNFNEVRAKCVEAGGEYMGGLGKQSHFRFPKDTSQPQKESAPQIPQLEQPSLQEIVDDLERVLTKLRKVAY